jgi:biotin operon repressor
MATVTKSRGITLAAAATLPPEIAGRLLADVDGIAQRMTRQIITETDLSNPRFRSLSYLRTLTEACRDAVRTLIRLLNDGRGLRQGDLVRLGSMGAQQAELGVPLEVVFGAYRVAAKVVWQDLVAQPALLNELPPATVVAVTGGVLQYLDEISAAVGSAYLATRERLMRQRDREREQVLQRLLAGDAGEELRRSAAAAGLDLSPPYTPVAVLADNAEDVERSLGKELRVGALVAGIGPGMSIVLLPAGQDVGLLTSRIPGTHLGVGPLATTLEQVSAASRNAQRALEAGRLLEPGRRVHRDDELGLLAGLALDHDAQHRFITAVFGAVLRQRPQRRAELLATLNALVTTSALGDAAAVLGVHRHTVVYRLSTLRKLGVDIDDVEARHRVWLALQCMRLNSGISDPTVISDT